MRTLYVIASGIWKAAKWVWTAIIVAILVSVASAIIPGETGKVVSSVAGTIIAWFRMFGPLQLITIGGIVFLTLLALASGFITVICKSYGPKYAPPPEVQAVFDYIKKDMETKTQKEELLQDKKKEAFMRYLHAVEQTNTYIRPRGFAQISQALVFADLPQDETFVDLQVVVDEPVYDEPGEQKRRLEAMRQRTDLSNDEREAYLQRLRIIWRSQLRWDVDEQQMQQPLPLIEVLQRFTPTSPVAILLGVPGSGKTTFLRWLALHMARACLSWGKYSLPQGFGHPQVPILIQTNDYAQRLEKEYITLKEFLIAQWNRIHPNLAMKLLEELAHGHCLVLFDGLDEGATALVRKRVLEAINGFIIEYSSVDPNIYNRFIITSRITDSEREAFSRYTHYTLIELDEQRIHQILTNLCLTLARYWTISVKGMQPLTESEEAEARAAGTKQQVQLLRILTSNPNLMRLAVNPMTLTMMVILQASGRNLPQQRMELIRVINQLLDRGRLHSPS
jgi:NACHT domain